MRLPSAYYWGAGSGATKSAASALLRGGLLLALAVVAIHSFGTLWYWLTLPLALVPLVEDWHGSRTSAQRLSPVSAARLAEDTAAAADQPANPVLRLNLGRSLLETGQIEAGLSALDAAVALAPQDDYIRTAAAEAKGRLVRFCPSCGQPNPAGAHVCRRCMTAMAGGAALRGLVRLCRPVWRRLHPSP